MSDALDDGDDIKEAEFLDGGVSLEEECERLTDSAGSLYVRTHTMQQSQHEMHVYLHLQLQTEPNVRELSSFTNL